VYVVPALRYSAASNTQGSELELLCIPHRHKVALEPTCGAHSGRWRGGAGSQEFMGARYQRYGCPDFDVRASRFEVRYIWFGPRAFKVPFFGHKGL
jgi:hypothetical protein